MKTIKIIFLIFTLGALTQSAEEPVNSETIGKEISAFESTANDAALTRQLATIERDRKLPEFVCADLMVRALVLVNDYLNAHQKPAETPRLTILVSRG